MFNNILWVTIFKTDRPDTESLKRAFLGWLRGEREHCCNMAAIPTSADACQEDRLCSRSAWVTREPKGAPPRLEEVAK